jgi:KaiC/GvpD/RAD55 family RecA-like ATPase
MTAALAEEKLKFGIESLDSLIGRDGDYGIAIPKSPGSTSLCLIGPDGTGKSVFALHLAASYVMNHRAADPAKAPRVLYFSTDLKHEMAERMWNDFKLGPRLESIVIDPDYTGLVRFLAEKPPQSVGFVDLASATAGDDWGLLNRVLSVLGKPAGGDGRHLIVIDAIEGFETMVGDFDAFGQKSSRRARIALLMRLAESKCHLVFVVEETKDLSRLPEEFVADIVIRLRSSLVNSYTRRTLEVEKARGQTQHTRGQHPFTIRSNRRGADGGRVEIFHSLHSVSRSLSQAGETNEESHDVNAARDRYCGFGIPYLDNMLGTSPNSVSGEKGIAAGSITSLIGDPSTSKSLLGTAFLSRAFASMADRLAGREAPRDEDGFALMFSSRSGSKSALAKRLAKHLIASDSQLRADRKHEQFEVSLANEIRPRLILDCMQMRDQPSAALFDSVSDRVRAAVSKLGTNRGNWRVRVLIDDLTNFRDTYPEIRQDPLFLPILIQFLEKQGVTTLVIATQPGRPDEPVPDAFDREVRALAQQQIYSWRVPFYGGSRVAISAIPSFSPGRPVAVRELVLSTDSGQMIGVDPHFELYAGLELGHPTPVPLEIRLFQETKPFKEYIDKENVLFGQIFTPLPGSSHGVIVGEPHERYDTVRDFCNLGSDMKLEHTLVFGVDEFWAPMSQGMLRDQSGYLNETTFRPEVGPMSAEDAFFLFQPTTGSPHTGAPLRRRDFFWDTPDREAETPAAEEDRVPFMWDFGFLTMAHQPWMNALKLELPKLNKTGSGITVGHVWHSLNRPEDGPFAQSPEDLKCPPLRSPSSWRAFFEACSEVARHRTGAVSKNTCAFEVSLVSPESFSCLLLEMWASEILEKLSRSSDPEAAGVFAQSLGGGRHRPDSTQSLIWWLQNYRNELYMCWLLLAEVLDFSRFADRDLRFEFRRDQPSDADPVASRNWYKTASASSGALHTEEAFLPSRLPGHFSIRGDWFLAVASGSRSSRLADRGLDLLSSRRANMTRLQLGLGLPTRALSDETQERNLRTRLPFINSKGRRATVAYKDLRTNFGSNEKEMSWMWRSNLAGYDRHVRPWERWLVRMLLAWQGFRTQFGGQWQHGFEVYDSMAMLGNDPTEEVNKLRSFEKLNEMCEFLIAELKSATLETPPKRT